MADPNEGWVMEMSGDDLAGVSGVWVAQRVPDDSLFVAANQFRIREVLNSRSGPCGAQGLETTTR